MVSPEKVIQNIRYILDLVYLVQKARGYYILSSFYDCSAEKATNNERLFRTISQLKTLKFDIIDINHYDNALKSIEEKINKEDNINFSIFSDYTSLVINPLINKVIMNFGMKHLKIYHLSTRNLLSNS